MSRIECMQVNCALLHGIANALRGLLSNLRDAPLPLDREEYERCLNKDPEAIWRALGHESA